MVKWTPKSESDLDEIREHIARNFSVDLAIDSVLNLVDQVEKILSDNPLAGKLVLSNPLFYQLVIEGNSVYYCENPKSRDLYIVYVQGRGTSFKKKRLG